MRVVRGFRAFAGMLGAASALTFGCARGPSCDEACKNVAVMGGLDEPCKNSCNKQQFDEKQRQCIADAKNLKQARLCMPEQPGTKAAMDKVAAAFEKAAAEAPKEPARLRYSVERIEVDGTLDDDGLRVLLDFALASVAGRCGDPEAGASLKLEFLVDKTSHRARGVTVQGAKNQELADCAKRALEGYDFVEGYGTARATTGTKY